MMPQHPAPPSTSPAIESLATRRPGLARYFFLALGCLYALVVVFGFVPSYQDYLAGTFSIHPLAHIHGAIMASFVVLFLAQTGLAAAGSVRTHRRLGLLSVGLAPLMWISMVAVARRPLVAENLPVDHFLYDVLLIELLAIGLFPVYFVWGFLARRMPPAHRRLMVFTILVILPAGIDRIRWLPHLGLPTHWGKDIYLYALLAPLVLYDVVSVGRIHRVTLIATAGLVAGHMIVNALWGTPAWHQLAFALTNAVR